MLTQQQLDQIKRNVEAAVQGVVGPSQQSISRADVDRIIAESLRESSQPPSPPPPPAQAQWDSLTPAERNTLTATELMTIGIGEPLPASRIDQAKRAAAAAQLSAPPAPGPSAYDLIGQGLKPVPGGGNAA